jgi:hypothetical protein
MSAKGVQYTQTQASLTEALRVELFAHGTDARLARLALLQLVVELLLQSDDLEARGRSAGHVLHPQLSVFRPLPAVKNKMKNKMKNSRVNHGRVSE